MLKSFLHLLPALSQQRKGTKKLFEAHPQGWKPQNLLPSDGTGTRAKNTSPFSFLAPAIFPICFLGTSERKGSPAPLVRAVITKQSKHDCGFSLDNIACLLPSSNGINSTNPYKSDPVVLCCAVLLICDIKLEENQIY